MEDELIDKELKVMVLWSTGNFAVKIVGLDTSFLGHWVVGEGIVVDDAEVVLPREALHLMVESWAEGMSDVLMAELVDSR